MKVGHIQTIYYKLKSYGSLLNYLILICKYISLCNMNNKTLSCLPSDNESRQALMKGLTNVKYYKTIT